MYYHDGIYYLYYLISDQHPGDGFGVATSPDGLHWEDHGWALRHSDKMVRYLGGTGPVWKDLSTADEIQFETDQGIVLEGTLNLPGCLTIHTGDGAGTEIRADEKGVVEVGTLKPEAGGFTCEERVDREIDFGASARFRLLLNRNMLEFYLNELLIQPYTMAKMPNGKISFRNARGIRLWHWK